MDRHGLLLAALLGSGCAHADQLKNVTYSPGVELNVGAGLQIELAVEGKSLCTTCPGQVIALASGDREPVRCGVQVNWGDGEKSELGLGKEMEPPFRFNHSYKSEGQYTVKITGVSLGSFFSPVPACRGDHSQSVRVVDATRISREKAAEEQRAVEQRRHAQRLAAAQHQKEQQQLIAEKDAAAEREAALNLAREQERHAERERQAAIAREQERLRQEEAARKAELALAQQRKEAEYEAEIKRLADGSDPIVWIETSTATTQAGDPAPALLEEVNSRLWEITSRSMKAAQKSRPVEPSYSEPVLRKKGEFEKTADYEAFVQRENTKHTAAFNAKLATYKKKLAAYESELAGLNNRKGEIYAQHAKQLLPPWLGSMDKAIRYDADKEHYVFSITSRRYPEYRIVGVLPIPISEAKAKNEQIRNAPITVILGIAGGSLHAKAVVVATADNNFFGSAASANDITLTENAARQRQEQLDTVARIAEEKRLQVEKERREEAERIAALNANDKAEADELAQKEAERLASVEAKKSAETTLKAGVDQEPALPQAFLREALALDWRTLTQCQFGVIYTTEIRSHLTRPMPEDEVEMLLRTTVAAAVAIGAQGPSIVDQSVRLSDQLVSKHSSLNSAKDKIDFVAKNFSSCTKLYSLINALPELPKSDTETRTSVSRPKPTPSKPQQSEKHRKEKTFSAVISCSLQGTHVNIYPCFDRSDLRITKNGRPKIYKLYELNAAGTMEQDGLHVTLPESFSIVAQNSDENLVLGVKIFNENGGLVFEDQQGKWGVINVGN